MLVVLMLKTGNKPMFSDLSPYGFAFRLECCEISLVLPACGHAGGWAEMKKVNKVVLAYSGGLDTSVIIPWLKENYGCDVIAYTANVGQNPAEFDGLEQKAHNSGASKFIIEDLCEEFCEDYIFPMVQSGAVYEGKYLLGTSIARPLIAKHMMDVVEREGADAVSHGCTGKGNDQVRFELTFKAFNPKIRIIAPWREWDLRSREDCVAYAQARKIPLTD